MITELRSYARQGTHTLRRWSLDPRFHTSLRIATCLLSGFFLSAASLGNYAQPFVLGLIFAAGGISAGCIALGGSLGYLLFWSNAGIQGVVWSLCGLAFVILIGHKPKPRTVSLLLPAAAGVIVAATGLAFQVRYGDTTPVLMYLLRIGLGMGCCHLFLLLEHQRSNPAQWPVYGIVTLAAAQIMPFPWLRIGFTVAGALSSGGAFPAAALSGLALDLAQVTPVPMTAVVTLSYFLRLLPGLPKWTAFLAPVPIYLSVMTLCGKWDLLPLPALTIGALLGRFLPGQQNLSHRRGETGIAQVRLELVAGVFTQMQLLLGEITPAPIDEAALVHRACQRLCGSCPCRKTCKDRPKAELLDPSLLHRPLLDGADLPFSCRKESRLLQELHRVQEQMRALRADRELQKEYRSALVQQYQFLSCYLQDLSDTLSKRIPVTLPRFKAAVAFCGNKPEADNGDRCLSFTGTGCRHYVLLCDGMGTGLGAVEEGRAASAMLKKLLLAGFPAEYALRSFNSLCALRGRAGASTVDLAELQLDTGKVTLYKWGAGPSYILHRTGVEKIGTASPPPGLSVTDGREIVEQLSLRRGETLVLCSDGVGGEEALRSWIYDPGEPLGELAAGILNVGDLNCRDDATVAAIRLLSNPTAT